MAPHRTKSGTPKLSEVARHLVLPEGIVQTEWPSVRDKCRDMGILFDRWQDGLGRAILSLRADGQYACGIGGVFMSIPRQVGKTFLVGAIVFALCILKPNLLVLWTAHHTRTSSETFRALQAFARRAKIAPFVERIMRGSGYQGIEFKNGSRILFGARENGFGRGFQEVDVVVYDEGQILSEKALDDMVPATNAAPNGLVLYMGTPPKPTDRSEVFPNRRREALEGELQDGLYVEFSADRHADPQDRSQWAKANPSFPHRTSETSILRLWRQLGRESFLREGLGIWDEDQIDPPAINTAQWARCGIGVDEVPDGIPSFGVRFSPDGTWVSIAVAVKPPDGPIFGELVASRSMVEGINWIVELLGKRKAEISTVVIDGKSDAAALHHALREKKWPKLAVNVGKEMLSPQAAADAYATLVNAVKTGQFTHLDVEGQAYLDESVEGSKKRFIGKTGAFGFAPINPDQDDPTPVEAVALARWGAEMSKRTPSGRRERGGHSLVM